MAAAGAPLRWIQEWLGHSDYRTTSIYADYAPDLSQAAHWAARAFDNAPPERDPGIERCTVLTPSPATTVDAVEGAVASAAWRSETNAAQVG